MAYGFWKDLPRPFFALAPMADVTDPPFRRMFAKYGKPDVLWTEFVSADGLFSPGRDEIMKRLAYRKNEHPIVAQIFGANPETVRKSAELIRSLGFDGLDINMGCPDKSIERQGAGAALIKDPKRAQEVILAAKEGARDMPVSVKTRIGYNKNTLEEWIPALLLALPAAITIHGRTRRVMSKVPADWDAIARAAEIIKSSGRLPKRPLVIGNGDVASLREARRKARTYGVDGVMIGRGAFGKPWFFDRTGAYADIPLKKQLRIMVEHTKAFEAHFKEPAAFHVMKKHFKAYVTGFPGARELRVALMGTANASEVQTLVDMFLKERE